MTPMHRAVSAAKIGLGLAVVAFAAFAEFRMRNSSLAGLCLIAMIGAVWFIALGFKQHLAEAPATAAPEAKFNSTVGAVVKLLQDYLDDNREFGERLNGASSKLAALENSEPVAAIVLALLKDNREMAAKVGQLSSGLSEARAQIGDLKTNLAKAEDDSLHDQVTGLGNRRYFDRELALEMEAARADRARRLSLIIADLDRFKRVNDTYGHVVGDTLLRLFGELLTRSVKGRDKVARYGGEEYAIVLPDTGLRDAALIANQIRKELESKRWLNARTGDRLGVVTASFGVAEFNPTESTASFVERADQMLYRAKDNGRNRVEADGPTSATRQSA